MSHANHESDAPTPAGAQVAGRRPARGQVRPPGDKSVAHRAVLLAALAEGRCVIENLPRGEDVGRTVAAVAALGASVEEDERGRVAVSGWGAAGPRSPDAALDLGNSGTTTRLLAGVLAGQPGLRARLVGDESLSRRPQRRVVVPLTSMGAKLSGSGPTHRLPLEIEGGDLRGIRYELPVASAQVKSCVLLAGLRARGTTAVREPGPCRDHTERMLPWFGWPVARRGAWIETACGHVGRAPRGEALQVVGDFSSGAFWMALAAGRDGAEVTVREVGLNPTRTGFLDALQRMGASVAVRETGRWCGEPVGDVRVAGGGLRALHDDGRELGRMVDEVPLIALLATQAEGETRLGGLAELRVKESDRIATVAACLSALAARLAVVGDELRIEGPTTLRGARCETHGDHRIAMMAAVAGTWAAGSTELDDAACVATSYPEFWETLAALTGSGEASAKPRRPG